MPSVGNVQLLALLLGGADKELPQQQSWALGMSSMSPSEHLPVHMLITSPRPLTGACTLHPDPSLADALTLQLLSFLRMALTHMEFWEWPLPLPGAP